MPTSLLVLVSRAACYVLVRAPADWATAGCRRARLWVAVPCLGIWRLNFWPYSGQQAVAGCPVHRLGGACGLLKSWLLNYGCPTCEYCTLWALAVMLGRW